MVQPHEAAGLAGIEVAEFEGQSTAQVIYIVGSEIERV